MKSKARSPHFVDAVVIFFHLDRRAKAELNCKGEEKNWSQSRNKKAWEGTSLGVLSEVDISPSLNAKSYFLKGKN